MRLKKYHYGRYFEDKFVDKKIDIGNLGTRRLSLSLFAKKQSNKSQKKKEEKKKPRIKSTIFGLKSGDA